MYSLKTSQATVKALNRSDIVVDNIGSVIALAETDLCVKASSYCSRHSGSSKHLFGNRRLASHGSRNLRGTTNLSPCSSG